jgi:transcriptional regulator with XRE-family HTH domain
MKRIPDLHLDNELIAGIVREAVNDRHMSLSEIASLAGLSITTPARIYHGSKNQVQIQTARKLAEALGYEIIIRSNGSSEVIRKQDPHPTRRLSQGQKDRVLAAVMKAVREELERF